MAPPGILLTDEHLDAVRSTCKNISAPAFSPLSKWSAPTTRGVNTSIFHDHDYVLPQHQQPFCESSTDSNSYEEIDIASIAFDDFVSKTVAEVGDATGVDDSNYGNKMTLASKHSVDNSKCHFIGVNDARLTENIDSHNTPAFWFMDDVDGAFLDELDNFDLELDEFDPCIDMDTEDSFQHFIEETLNSPTTNTCMEDEYGLGGVTEDEDTLKKEYFLKLLGLQSVSPHTTQNREAFLEDCDTNTTRPHTLAQGTSAIGVEIGEVSVCQKTSHPFPPSAIAPHPSSLAASVPAKMCSCAASDWKDSVLYSTAPACSNGLVQTNLSTAPTTSIAYNMAAQNFRFASNSDGANVMHSSPAVGSLNTFEDFTAHSLHRDGLQLKNQSDADAFLQWLEEDGESVSSIQAGTEMSERSRCTNFKNDMSAQPTLGDTNGIPDSNHLSASHSISDLDSFIDLETYAMEKSPSSIQLGKDTHSNSYISGGRVRDAKVHPDETLGRIESKYPPGSELQFRLSLLDDLSYREDRYSEKRDASCPFGVSADDVNGTCKDFTFDDALADLTSDAASSPLSPYSSSSVNSSYGQPKGGEDSLDLLGLFSEENSFLLMEQSDSRYGFC